MTRMVLLSLTLIMGTLFMFHRPQGQIGFLFDDVTIHADTYVYYVMEHLIKIIFVVVIWELDAKYRALISILLGLEVLDLIDFVLTYNSRWYKYLSINTFKAAIFGMAISYECWKKNK